MTPGFQFWNSGAGTPGRANAIVSFRGLSVFQPNPTSQSGSVFWNGGYMAAGSAFLPIYDVERVEIIKGPQTALYGTNTFAGAVNFVPASPGDEFSGKASVSYSPSHQDGYNITAAAGGPVTDKFGLRVAGMHERVGGDWYYDNGEALGEENTTSISATAEFEPSESFRLKLNGFYVDGDDTSGHVSQLGPVLPGDCNIIYTGDFKSIETREITRSYTTDLSTLPRRTFCGEIPDFDDPNVPLNFSAAATITDAVLSGGDGVALLSNLPPELKGHVPNWPGKLGGNYDLWRVDLGAEYDVANDHTFSFQIARGESGAFNLSDSNHGLPRPGNPETAGIRLGSIVRGTVDTNVEARITSGDEERLRYMIGVNYYKLRNYQGFNSGTWFVLRETRENYGVFGSLDYDITEEFTLSLEGRYAEDDLTVDFSGTTGQNPYSIEDRTQSFGKFMPRVILSYQPTDDLNIYTNWSQSYIQGQNSEAARYRDLTGIDLGIGVFTPTQKLDAYEIGVKQTPLDWLNYSLAGYYYDWKNQTFGDVVFTAIGFVSAQVPGDSRVYGLDFETNMSPTEWFDLTLGLTYLDVKFTDYAAAGSPPTAVFAVGANPGRQPGELFSADGNTPRYTPEWRGNFTGTLNVDRLTGMERPAWISLTGTWQDDFFVDNHNYGRVKGFWKFNMRAGVAVSDQLTVELYGNNITNDLSRGNFGGTTTAIGTPNGDRKTFGPISTKREVGVKLSATF